MTTDCEGYRMVDVFTGEWVEPVEPGGCLGLAVCVIILACSSLGCWLLCSKKKPGA